MRVSVFGLGYVGCVTSACLARAGHEVVGVDLNREKVEMISTGRSPIVEPGLGELLEIGRSPSLGCVTSACLARAGHEVVGVDLNREKVEMISTGRSPIVEPGLGELL